MSNTIGDLVDQLSIANIRLWHIEDDRREFTARLKERQTPYGPGEASLAREDAAKSEYLLDMVAKVNKERNSLIDQINAGLAVLIDKARNKDSTFELTADELLGTGKNKFYKTEDRA